MNRLPSNAIGDAAVRALRAEGVVTDFIVRGGSRMGIYFTETGASQRASTVLYDRANSAISEIPADAVNWDRVMSRAEWFHVTGITPALGPRGAAATAAAVGAAKRAGARISVDLNYRKKLWSTADAQQAMRPLMRDVSVVIANEEDLQCVLGIEVEGADVTSGSLNVDAYRAAAERVTRELGPQMVAITLRKARRPATTDGARCSGMARRCTRVVVCRPARGSIGGGDSFAAGLIYGP